MNSYHSSWHKTSRNWSKPRKWSAFLFNVKIVYTARWRLFATPDTPWVKVPLNEQETSLLLYIIFFSFKKMSHGEGAPKKATRAKATTFPDRAAKHL